MWRGVAFFRRKNYGFESRFQHAFTRLIEIAWSVPHHRRSQQKDKDGTRKCGRLHDHSWLRSGAEIATVPRRPPNHTTLPRAGRLSRLNFPKTSCVMRTKRSTAAVRRALSRRIRACGLAGGSVAKGMKKISYSGYRFPPEIIQQAIWLYLRFTLSFRDVEDLLAERGIMVSYETVRRWVNHFGPMIAADLRKRRPKPHTTWHLDEVYLKIDGRMVYLWRAVDAEGEVLDVLVQTRRNKRAALKLMRKLLKKYGFVPDKLVTDDLRSYDAAARDLGIANRHRARSMAQQSSREFASTDPTTRTQDARFQERRVSAKISLNPRSDLQHLQRPTPSHLSKNAPSLPGIGDADMARSRRRGVISATRNFSHQISNNVTKPRWAA